MSGLVSKPRTVRPPAAKPPLAVPTAGEEVGTQARRRLPRGRIKTFLTGDLIPMLEEEKKVKFG